MIKATVTGSQTLLAAGLRTHLVPALLQEKAEAALDSLPKLYWRSIFVLQRSCPRQAGLKGWQ